MFKILYDTTDKEKISDLVNDQDDLVSQLYFIIDRQDAIINNLTVICQDLQALATSRVRATHMKNAINIVMCDLREVEK